MKRSDSRSSGFISRNSASLFLGNYHTRILSTLALSLLCLNLVFRLPVPDMPGAVGWHFNAQPDGTVIDLLELPEKEAAEQTHTTPITRFNEPVPETVIDEAEKEEETMLETEPLPEPPASEVAKLDTRKAILEFSEKQPSIVGGLGAYYLNIQYPQAAIDAGIHGRLVLNFVVEPDGRASHIEVLQSLHPLCDSAAVRSLRKTRFVPGRQNGENVRVRMRLPVRFELIGPGEPEAADTR